MTYEEVAHIPMIPTSVTWPSYLPACSYVLTERSRDQLTEEEKT